jgi:iron complex transport system ATP-binding protein
MNRKTHISAADLTLEHITWAPTRKSPLILQVTSFHLGVGQMLGIVGRKGAGKTTLLRLICGYHIPRSGHVYVGNTSLASLAPRAVARKVATVAEEQPTDFALSIREIVSLGRMPHRLGFTTPNSRDGLVIDAALDLMDLTSVADRGLAKLSGGERLRVMVARALAQEPQVLVMDQPAHPIEMRHELDVLHRLRTLNLTGVTAHQDLARAADVCDQILGLDKGQMRTMGTPAEVLSVRERAGRKSYPAVKVSKPERAPAPTPL